MSFEVVTTMTIVHHGKPDNSIFKIYLEDGTTIVGTDEYPACDHRQLTQAAPFSTSSRRISLGSSSVRSWWQ